MTINDELIEEMVIIVEGASEVVKEEEFEQTIDEQINMFIEKGMSVKDAIKETARIRKLRKNDIYNEYHKK